MSSISGAAGILSQQNGWYLRCVDVGFNCDANGNPLYAGNTITVYCGGSAIDVSCLPPPEAVFWSTPFRTNLLNPGLAPGDVPAGSLAQGVFQGSAATWNAANQINDPRFFVAWYGTSAMVGLGPETTALLNDIWTSGGAPDIIQQLTPPPSIPSTWPGWVVFGGGQAYDWYENH
jgi:hypothetical protein